MRNLPGTSAISAIIGYAITVVLIQAAFAQTGLDEGHVFKDEMGKPIWRFHGSAAEVKGFQVGPCKEMVFSEDGRHVAYAAYTSFDSTEDHFVIDGVAQKRYDEVGEIVFSPNGKRVAYAAKRGENGLVVVDGVEGKQYPGGAYGIVFSPDSKRVGYGARGSDISVVVVDGKEVTTDWFALGYGAVLFSPDSTRFAYAADEGAKQVLFLDGKSRGEFDEVEGFSVRFTPDSKNLSYAYRREGKWFAVFGEKSYGPFDAVSSILAEVSADSRRIAIPVRIGENWFVEADKRYGPFRRYARASFSPDSASLAIEGGGENEATLIVNDKMIGKFDDIDGSVFSPDSKHFAFCGTRASVSRLYVDGTAVEGTPGAEEVVYSKDSKRLAAVVRKDGKSRVLEGNRAGGAYDSVTALCFSGDSAHLAYWGGVGLGAVLVVDGVETLRVNLEGGPYLSFDEKDNIYGIASYTTDEEALSSYNETKKLDSFFKACESARLVLFRLSPAGTAE